MRNKNWIEFNNEENLNVDNQLEDVLNRASKINIYKQKKGKKGKTVTYISGLNIDNQLKLKDFFKKMKIFCGTGGKINPQNIQLQGDMELKVKEFIRKEGYKI